MIRIVVMQQDREAHNSLTVMQEKLYFVLSVAKWALSHLSC